eukprot:SAG22_NODE_2343_length_2686_cov_1.989563_1_plen_237_part_00
MDAGELARAGHGLRYRHGGAGLPLGPGPTPPGLAVHREAGSAPADSPDRRYVRGTAAEQWTDEALLEYEREMQMLTVRHSGAFDSASNDSASSRAGSSSSGSGGRSRSGSRSSSNSGGGGPAGEPVAGPAAGVAGAGGQFGGKAGKLNPKAKRKLRGLPQKPRWTKEQKEEARQQRRQEDGESCSVPEQIKQVLVPGAAGRQSRAYARKHSQNLPVLCFVSARPPAPLSAGRPSEC